MSSIYLNTRPNVRLHDNISVQNRDTPAYKIAGAVLLFLGALFSFLTLPLDAGLACGGFLLFSSFCYVCPRQPSFGYQTPYVVYHNEYQNRWFPPVFRTYPVTNTIYHQPTYEPILRQNSAPILRQLSEGKSSGARR